MYKAIIGLGNPGPQFSFTRHNIGFIILDALADEYTSSWHTKNNFEYTQITFNNTSVLFIKPQTYMNNSGEVWGYLAKQGIKPEEILVVHDELELPFGKIALKKGGSAKGHNGLKSLISYAGDTFNRLRFGIGRPAQREDVPHYVLQKFTKAESQELPELITQAIKLITD